MENTTVYYLRMEYIKNVFSIIVNFSLEGIYVFILFCL
jgi:hypothetical protein